jgi:hypothetical protein
MGKLQFAVIFLVVGVILLAKAWEVVGPVFLNKPIPVMPNVPVAVPIEKRSKVTLWYYTHYVENGSIQYTASPEGIRVEMTGSDGSFSLKPDRGMSVSVMGQERKSLFSGWAESPGDYQLTVRHTGAPLRLVVTVGAGILEILGAFAVGSAGVLLLLVAGVLALLGITRERKPPVLDPWDQVGKKITR